MNLGGAFAGGLTRGMEARQAFDERKAENEFSRNLRGRQMEMNEVEFKNKQADRASDDAMKKQMAEIVPKFYGEQEVEDGEAFDDDGMGNITRIPIKKKVKFVPGMDPSRDLGFMGEMMRLSMSSGKYDPAQFQKTWESVQAAKKTELGNTIEGTLRGDKASMNKFLASMGKSPEGAQLKVDVKNGVAQIVLANGEPVDLMPALMASAKADAFKSLLDARETSSKVALNESATRENEAEITQLIPARVAAQLGSANASNSTAEYNRTVRTNLTNSRADALDAKGVKIPGKGIEEAVYDSGARAAVTIYAQGLTKGGVTPDVAAMQAIDKYNKAYAAAKAKGFKDPQKAAAQALENDMKRKGG